MSLLSLRNSRKVGKFVGFCFYFTKSRLFQTSQTNLKLCFPDLGDEERLLLVKRSLENTGMTLAESGSVWLWPISNVINSITEIEGSELFHNAMALGKGLVLLGPHHGNWELMGLYLSSLGKCSQLYQEPKNPELAKLVLSSRSRGSASLYPASSKGVAAVLGSLRRGEMTGILPDQIPAPNAGEFAPFFGQDAYTMTLISRLLQKTEAKALLCYAKRTQDGFKVIFKQPDPDIYAEHMPTALKGLNKTVEMAALDEPEQYQWEYKRFRYQPEGKDEPYSRTH